MRLGLLTPVSALSILLLIPVSQSRAQTQQRDNRPRTASISGRVTVDGKPAANASVMVAEVDPRSRGEWPHAYYSESQQRAFIKVRTDGDGRYRVTGLTEGDYLIRALSKAYVRSKNSPDFNIFRSVTLDDSESRDNVDIALVRGGVITGRVIDADGGPFIGGYMRLLPLDENGKPKEGFDFDNGWMMYTDDRGVYRIYGLPAGRFILSTGGEEPYSGANRVYPRTFYPDTTDQNQAKIVEVKEGAEVAEIDIRLGVGKNTYYAAGRVLDAETGQPLPLVSVVCTEAPDKEEWGERSHREVATDDEGRFRFTGLSSGRYDLFLSNRIGIYARPSVSMGGDEHYSEKTRVEVSDSDVSGLEVKAIRGSTISGVVVLEDAGDRAIKAKLHQVHLIIHVISKPESGSGGIASGRASAKIASDGSFHLSGAQPGMASFHFMGSQETTFSIKRIERDGAEIKSAFEIRRGEQITGVRIVVVHANGTIRGQVEVAGGKLPEGWQLQIWAAPIRPTADDERYPAFRSGYGHAVADEKGRFVIEKLAAGEYELKLNAMVRVGQYDWNSAPGTSEIKQRITVSSVAETPVKLTFDPARR